MDRDSKQQLSQLAKNDQTSVWVDSNVLMYSTKANKDQLLSFPHLRTIPEVLTEVRKRPPETSYFLEPLLTQAVVVALSSFAASGDLDSFRFVSVCSQNYSPLTRAAIQQGRVSQDSLSPFANNILANATVDSTIFGQAELFERVRAKFVELYGNELSGLDKLKKSWRDYHSKRVKGLREESYLWTDELLVASAITDAFSNNCIAIIVTNDWDSNVILKQFSDNVIAAIVDKQTQDVDSWWNLYSGRCQQFDNYLLERRAIMAEAILDGDLFGRCQGGDVFIWQYPTNGFWSFSFDQEFIGTVRKPISSE